MYISQFIKKTKYFNANKGDCVFAFVSIGDWNIPLNLEPPNLAFLAMKKCNSKLFFTNFRFCY